MGAWHAAVHGVAESNMTERLNWAELKIGLVLINTNKEKNPKEKWAQDINKLFPKETHMANKYNNL